MHGARAPGAVAYCYPSTIDHHIPPPGLAFGKPNRPRRRIRYAAAFFFFAIAWECPITLFGRGTTPEFPGAFPQWLSFRETAG
jgi:hypothetical protein